MAEKKKNTAEGLVDVADANDGANKAGELVVHVDNNSGTGGKRGPMAIKPTTDIAANGHGSLVLVASPARKPAPFLPPGTSLPPGTFLLPGTFLPPAGGPLSRGRGDVHRDFASSGTSLSLPPGTFLPPAGEGGGPLSLSRGRGDVCWDFASSLYTFPPAAARQRRNTTAIELLASGDENENTPGLGSFLGSHTDQGLAGGKRGKAIQYRSDVVTEIH